MGLNEDKYKINNNINLWKQIALLNNKFEIYKFDEIKCSSIKKYEKRTTKDKYGDDRFLNGGFTCKFDYKDFLAKNIYVEMDLYEPIIEKYMSVWKAYELYEKAVFEIFNSLRLYKDINSAPKDNRNWLAKIVMSQEERFSILKKYEEDLLDKRTYSPCFPTVELELSCKTYYNSYCRTDTYSWKNILECYELAQQKSIREGFIKQQRAIVSDSLRYDIMRRDGFRCCICGATAKDGVNLEVDHIIPISKGGQSTMDNLQTLCERCNRGKRDK